jgi:hypothetical protein
MGYQNFLHEVVAQTDYFLSFDIPQSERGDFAIFNPLLRSLVALFPQNTQTLVDYLLAAFFLHHRALYQIQFILTSLPK